MFPLSLACLLVLRIVVLGSSAVFGLIPVVKRVFAAGSACLSRAYCALASLNPSLVRFAVVERVQKAVAVFPASTLPKPGETKVRIWSPRGLLLP